MLSTRYGQAEPARTARGEALLLHRADLKCLCRRARLLLPALQILCGTDCNCRDTAPEFNLRQTCTSFSNAVNLRILHAQLKRRYVTHGEHMSSNLKHKSHIITDGPDRAGARSMLKAIGFTDEDLAKPIVGIANTWIETMPCNYHLRALAEKVKAGVRAAGGTPMELNTIAISDGVTMGTEGMKASLVSREVVADSIELVGRGHMFDAMVALVGCDKTIPGGAMALIRLNVPSVLLYGGSIAAGRFQNRDVTVGDVYEAIGANAAGLMTDKDLKQLEDHACPGAGACGGQFTANT